MHPSASVAPLRRLSADPLERSAEVVLARRKDAVPRTEKELTAESLVAAADDWRSYNLEQDMEPVCRKGKGTAMSS